MDQENKADKPSASELINAVWFDQAIKDVNDVKSHYAKRLTEKCIKKELTAVNEEEFVKEINNAETQLPFAVVSGPKTLRAAVETVSTHRVLGGILLFSETSDDPEGQEKRISNRERYLNAYRQVLEIVDDVRGFDPLVDRLNEVRNDYLWNVAFFDHSKPFYEASDKDTIVNSLKMTVPGRKDEAYSIFYPVAPATLNVSDYLTPAVLANLSAMAEKCPETAGPKAAPIQRAIKWLSKTLESTGKLRNDMDAIDCIMSALTTGEAASEDKFARFKSTMGSLEADMREAEFSSDLINEPTESTSGKPKPWTYRSEWTRIDKEAATQINKNLTEIADQLKESVGAAGSFADAAEKFKANAGLQTRFSSPGVLRPDSEALELIRLEAVRHSFLGGSRLRTMINSCLKSGDKERLAAIKEYLFCLKASMCVKGESPEKQQEEIKGSAMAHYGDWKDKKEKKVFRGVSLSAESEVEIKRKTGQVVLLRQFMTAEFEEPTAQFQSTSVSGGSVYMLDITLVRSQPRCEAYLKELGLPEQLGIMFPVYTYDDPSYKVDKESLFPPFYPLLIKGVDEKTHRIMAEAPICVYCYPEFDKAVRIEDKAYEQRRVSSLLRLAQSNAVNKIILCKPEIVTNVAKISCLDDYMERLCSAIDSASDLDTVILRMCPSQDRHS